MQMVSLGKGGKKKTDTNKQWKSWLKSLDKGIDNNGKREGYCSKASNFKNWNGSRRV